METITELFERYPSLAMCGENLTAALDLWKKTVPLPIRTISWGN